MAIGHVCNMALGQYHCHMKSKTPQDTESRHADKYIVRFPEGMREQLKEEARLNKRTMNAEIVSRLDESLRASARFRMPKEELAANLDQIMENLRTQIAYVLDNTAKQPPAGEK